ncbi:MAG: SDR family oxidoreductase [Nocardioidaceae bacterium]|nr:SDR family oxidoreductase [Nocardioidaceae bacterium]
MRDGNRNVRKRILITGASSGLGAGMARLFAARGRDLALTARRTGRLEALRSELEAAHPGIRVETRTLDVNDHDAVAAAFDDCRQVLGGLDRVIVNAGLGKGARIGSGQLDANVQTATTNLVGALAQCEAAMAAFYAAGQGHLVVVSSVTAVRGMPSAITTYGATKAAVAALAEGIRSDVSQTPIAVTTLFPGYIRSEMNEQVAHKVRFMVDTETGCRAMVAAIEREVAEAYVPRWPWAVSARLMRLAPLGAVRRLV